MIASHGPTPSELKAFNRRQAFRASIAKQAAELKAAAKAAPAVPKEPRAATALSGEYTKPKEKHWFWIVGVVSNVVTIGMVKQAVSDEFGVSIADLIGPRRHISYTLPRQLAMWLSKELCRDKSLPVIGREFGGRDHTTILHATRVAPWKVAADPDLAERVARIRSELEAVQRSSDVLCPEPSPGND